MRTEVKVGLIAGFVVIGAALIFLFNKGSSTGQPADIPWNANPDQGKSKEGTVAVTDTAKNPKGTLAGKPGEKTDPLRRPPQAPAARPAERPTATARPSLPPVSRQRTTLPPVASTQRTIVTPPAEPRIAATPEPPRTTPPREVAPPTTATPAPETATGESLQPRVPETVAARTEPAESRPAEPARTPDDDETRPLRVGPLPRPVPAPSTALPPAQPQSTGTPVATPGVPIPPRPAEAMRVDEAATRIRDAGKPKPEPMRYTVAESDTLIYIARQKYGDGKYWTKIRDANPGLNPDHLLVGQVLIIPSKEEVTGTGGKPAPAADAKPGAVAAARPATAAAAEAKETTAAKTDTKTTRPNKTYVVAAGDSLATIARNVLGDGSRWREIYELNRDKIKNPDVLLEGVELKLPENGAKPAAGGAKTPATAPKPANGAKKAKAKP